MSIQKYTGTASVRATPQSQPILGAGQTRNHAGGYTWEVDDWDRLQRFLILGGEGGTYYVGESRLVRENAASVLRCIQVDGARAVAQIVGVSTAGRAPKPEPAIFALAMAMKLGDLATRQAAQAAVPAVCRTGTHLFAFAEAVQAFGGWGRGTRRAFSDWYTGMAEEDLVLQTIKYQQRQGWSHRDLLRLSKPAGHGPDTTRGAVFHWITRGWAEVGPEPHQDPVLARIWAFERAKTADEAETVRLIERYSLPRECVATANLNSPLVWDALLHTHRGMPLTALVRNLGKMSAVGLLTRGSAAARTVVDRLGDRVGLLRSRIHPLALLTALRTYQSGAGDRGGLTWVVEDTVVSALDSAFYASFGNVAGTGKRVLLAVDVSGSMAGSRVAGLNRMSACEAAAAMAMVTANVEREPVFVAFDTEVKALDIAPKLRLDVVTRKIEALVNGGTDCAAPIVYAEKRGLPVGAFVLLTDSETWQGRLHPEQALQGYRRKTGLSAKMAVVAMASTRTSVADPDDPGVLNCVGFDATTPTVIASFVC